MPEIKDIGVDFDFDFEIVDAEEIVDAIKAIDATGTARFMTDGLKREAIGLKAIKDWATKPVIAKQDGTFKGKPFKAGDVIRGPIADSLEEYLGGSMQSTRFVWNTVMDDNTGDLDSELDGKEFAYDDPNAPIPPLHTNCRCTREPLPPDEKVYKESLLQ